MKKIIFIVLCLIFFLGGCGNSVITEQDLIDSGYMLNNEGDYVYNTSESSSVFVSGVDDRNTLVGIEVHPTSYLSMQLTYSYSEDYWDASYYDGWVYPDVMPNDVYAYFEDIAPEAITEFKRLTESTNISTNDIEGGDKTIIEKLVSQNATISNVKIIDNLNTNPQANGIDYNPDVQVNFDLTNSGTGDINLEDLLVDICYDTPDEGCKNLTSEAPGDTELTDKTLKPGETINIQMSGEVPKDVTNFHIQVYTQEFFTSSEIVD